MLSANTLITVSHCGKYNNWIAGEEGRLKFLLFSYQCGAASLLWKLSDLQCPQPKPMIKMPVYLTGFLWASYFWEVKWRYLGTCNELYKCFLKIKMFAINGIAPNMKCKYIFFNKNKIFSLCLFSFFKKSGNLESHFPGVFLSPDFISASQTVKVVIFLVSLVFK